MLTSEKVYDIFDRGGSDNVRCSVYKTRGEVRRYRVGVYTSTDEYDEGVDLKPDQKDFSEVKNLLTNRKTELVEELNCIQNILDQLEEENVK